MIEEWRYIDGCGERYQISNLGHVKITATGKLISPGIRRQGYHGVILTVRGKRINRLVHRLVALAFIPNPQNKSDVNHKDFVTNNNNVTNLEWATSSENRIHSIRAGRKVNVFTKENAPKKLTQDDLVAIMDLRSNGLNQRRIAHIFRVHPSSISKAISRNK